MANPTNKLIDPGSGQDLDPPGNWSVTKGPATGLATAAQAVVRKAGAAGLRLVVNGIAASVATGATAQTPLGVAVWDCPNAANPGDPGTTVVWEGALSAPANQVGSLNETWWNIQGKAGSDLVMQFSGAGVAASQQAITMSGYWAVQ